MGVDPRIERTQALFAAWSSGDVDAPRHHLTEDAILYDVIGGEYRGWEAIRAYFAYGLQRYPDLALVPTGEFWTRDDSVALTWVMSATVTDDRFGPAARGRRWHAEGMSYLVFRNGLVAKEADFHDAGSRERSLRVADDG